MVRLQTLPLKKELRENPREIAPPLKPAVTGLRAEFILYYMPLVESIVKRFSFNKLPRESREDLMQVGTIGLIKAVDQYNSQKGTLFSTYATHQILGEIRHYLRDKTNLIRPPRWLRYLNQKVFSEAALLTQELGHFPTSRQLADRLNIQEEGIEELRKLNEMLFSFFREQEWNENLQPLQEKICTQHLVSFQLPIEDKLILIQAIQKLLEVEQKVIYLFFYYDLTQSEIGKRLGLSQRSVSRVIQKALGKLKEILSRG